MKLIFFALLSVVLIQADLASFLRDNKLQKYKSKLAKEDIIFLSDIRALMEKPVVQVNRMLKQLKMTPGEMKIFKTAGKKELEKAKMEAKKEAKKEATETNDEKAAEVERFLTDNKLGQYIPDFQKLGVEELVDLLHVTEDDLVEMGASKIKIRAFLKARKALGLEEKEPDKKPKNDTKKHAKQPKFNSRGHAIIPRIDKPLEQFTDEDIHRMPMSQFLEAHNHKLDDPARKHLEDMEQLGVDLDVINVAMLTDFQKNPEALLAYTDPSKMQGFASTLNDDDQAQKQKKKAENALKKKPKKQKKQEDTIKADKEPEAPKKEQEDTKKQEAVPAKEEETAPAKEEAKNSKEEEEIEVSKMEEEIEQTKESSENVEVETPKVDSENVKTEL